MRACLFLLLTVLLFSCKEKAVPLHTPYFMRGAMQELKEKTITENEAEADIHLPCVKGNG